MAVFTSLLINAETHGVPSQHVWGLRAHDLVYTNFCTRIAQTFAFVLSCFPCHYRAYTVVRNNYFCRAVDPTNLLKSPNTLVSIYMYIRDLHMKKHGLTYIEISMYRHICNLRHPKYVNKCTATGQLHKGPLSLTLSLCLSQAAPLTHIYNSKT